MNEIEKMYKNVGVEKEERYSLNCEYYEKYPPFTAEKQIEILKLILKKRRILDVGYIVEEDKYHCMHYECVFDSFEEALCADVNYHWKDLTPEQKQQAKGILEMRDIIYRRKNDSKSM